MPIYHLEHEVGSGWSPEGEALLRQRIAERGITWLDACTVYIWAAVHAVARPPDDFQRLGLGPGRRFEPPSCREHRRPRSIGRQPSAYPDSHVRHRRQLSTWRRRPAMPRSSSRMRDRMAHRGPDGVGIWTSRDRQCTLGHRRLSIIDLSDVAAQPMSNCAGTVTLTFNGEIYNHAELRRELQALGKYQWKTDHSDTEVLLHAYEEWGVDCVKKFYGMFAVGIFDARDPERPVLHLIRDRVGIKPMYFTRTGRGEWLFASEIRALVAHPDVTRGDGSHGVLALPHVHRRAGAAHDVPRHLQAAGRPCPDHRPPRRRRAPGRYWDCAPDRAHHAERARHQRAGSRRRADAAAEAVDRAADGVGRAVRRAAVRRRRLVDERGADERADGRARSPRSRSATRGKRTTTSFSSRGASPAATRPIITRR